MQVNSPARESAEPANSARRAHNFPDFPCIPATFPMTSQPPMLSQPYASLN
jgi:hypothetical protein